MNFPRRPAAFINAIADEGTKAEAVEWLQKTWDELQVARSAIREANSCLVYSEGIDLLYSMDENSLEGRYVEEVTK